MKKVLLTLASSFLFTLPAMADFNVSAEEDNFRRGRKKVVCYAKAHHRGRTFRGVAKYRFVAKRRAIRKCRSFARNPYRCHIRYCHRVGGRR